MARITTVTNQKGGVSKTTTTHALATGLTDRGLKVLVVDVDPQANISYTMGVDRNLNTVYGVLKEEISVLDAIQKTPQGDVLPSSLGLAGADMEFTQTGREYILGAALEQVKDSYDYIVIDTPPTLGILTINALTCCNDVIVPMIADIYSIQGLAQLYKTISKVKQFCNRNLAVSGILLTRYNSRTVLSQELKEIIEKKAKELNTKVFKTLIRESIAVKEAQSRQTSIFSVLAKNNPAHDYLSFIEEYLEA